MLPRFYPIIDTAVLARATFTPIQLAEELAAAGAAIMQYRHKDTWTQKQFDEARTIAGICHAASIKFIVNDRADFAHLLKAGLHIGQDDLPPAAARKVVGDAVIGFSTHNAGQLRKAIGAPVDYFSIGPIFATTSKQKPDPVVGVEGLRAVRSLSAKPLVAIGGVTLDNAGQVLDAGASSVAVISALLPPDGDLKRLLTQWTRFDVQLP